MMKIMMILFATTFATNFADPSTKAPETFVMTAVDPTSAEAEETSDKAFLATPLHEASEETKAKGRIVVANPVDNSDEDLVTADSIVYRPLFAYRKKMARRQRIRDGQVDSGNYPSYPTYPQYPQYGNRRIYYVHRSYPGYYRAPVQEKRRLTRPRMKEAEFPVLA